MPVPNTVVSGTNKRISLRLNLCVALLFAATLLIVFHGTVMSMIAIWMRSETFAHGFLIFPISLWLIWHRREQWQEVRSPPSPWILLTIIPLGCLWSVAHLVDVLVVQQLALVAILIAGVCAIVGIPMARLIAFPLGYLFLSVPMGESLIEPMMDFTAVSTVWLIQESGIPVYREGLYFSLPSGNWSVVEACSGVRYIIASVTLGLLYANLTYRSLWRRSLFVLLAVVVPVLANTLRAYLIVMLGHWSDMKIATGVDHLVYGWVFFGLVMFVMFWLGSFFQESDKSATKRNAVTSLVSDEKFSLSPLACTAIAAFILASLWPAVIERAQLSEPISIEGFSIPEPPRNWVKATSAPWMWQPDSVLGGEKKAFFANDESTVGIYLQYLSGENDVGEVIGSLDRFTIDNAPNRILEKNTVGLSLADVATRVQRVRISDPAGDLLAWSWYFTGCRYSANDYRAKILELMTMFGLCDKSSARIIMTTEVLGSLQESQYVAEAFIQEYSERLLQNLNNVSPGKSE